MVAPGSGRVREFPGSPGDDRSDLGHLYGQGPYHLRQCFSNSCRRGPNKLSDNVLWIWTKGVHGGSGGRRKLPPGSFCLVWRGVCCRVRVLDFHWADRPTEPRLASGNSEASGAFPIRKRVILREIEVRRSLRGGAHTYAVPANLAVRRRDGGKMPFPDGNDSSPRRAR